MKAQWWPSLSSWKASGPICWIMEVMPMMWVDRAAIGLREGLKA